MDEDRYYNLGSHDKLFNQIDELTDALASRDADIESLRQQLVDTNAAVMHESDVAESYRAEADSLRQQLTDSQKREVMLRDALRHLWNARTPDSLDEAGEALAATADLSSLVICDAEPVGYNVTTMDNKQILMRTACHIVGHVSEPLYARKEQK